MQKTHYLFHITSNKYFCHLLTLYTEKRQFCFNCAVSGQRSPQCTIEHCTVLLHGTIEY